MKKYTIEIVGSSPLLFSGALRSPKDPRETSDAYELRVWKERAHELEDTGYLYVPSFACHRMLVTTARYLSQQIPGKGKATYTKHFLQGMRALNNLVFEGVTIDDVVEHKDFVPSDGKTGGGKRVWRHFPKLMKWGGTISYIITDDILIREVLDKTVETAGLLNGLGTWRPQNGGSFGSFTLVGSEFEEFNI